jgi:hypothetical protein
MARLQGPKVASEEIIMEKKKNRILKVWTETRLDENPDTSWIGEYTDELEPCVILRARGEFYEHLPEDADWPSRGREYRGFRPYAGGEKPGTENFYVYGMRDFQRMEALERGDWCFVGIMAKAEVVTPSGTIQILRSGGLWGIESDSDESYLGEIRAEQLDELRDELDAFGFGKRAIDYAIQRVEHRPLGG